jgi:hypothetical protein
VAKYLGILFGIALSSDGDPSARVMACHALCACKRLDFTIFEDTDKA